MVGGLRFFCMYVYQNCWPTPQLLAFYIALSDSCRYSSSDFTVLVKQRNPTTKPFSSCIIVFSHKNQIL